MAKRITSPELVEIRTVLSRAKTALRYVGNSSNTHTDHELSLMRSALITSIGVLEKAELMAGYREVESDGS